MKRVFSIRMKFLLVTSSLLGFCILVYLAVAATAIRKDKTNLVFDYNRNLVESLATDLDVLLNSSVDKLELVSYLQASSTQNTELLVDQLIGERSEIFWVFKSSDFKTVNEDLYRDSKFLETYNASEADWRQALSQSIPFEEIQKLGESVWSVKVAGSPPLLGVGKNVVFEDKTGVQFEQFALVAFLKTDRIVKVLESVRAQDLFVLSSSGDVLLNSRRPETSETLVQGAYQQLKSRPLKTNVSELVLEGERFLSGSSRAFQNRIFVMSLTSEARAFAIVDMLVRRSLHIAAILAFLAFFAAYAFSRSLTKPIETLVNGMKRVAAGQLDTRIHIQSGDEISVLAKSFNQMISDLEQSRAQLEEINRDLEGKVKERTLQLEKQNQAVKSAQEALLRTTRLAAVGEIAGRAAHEVLNPLTSILSRIQNVKTRLERKENTDLQVLEAVVNAWSEEYQKGGFPQLVESWSQPSEVLPEKTLWEEDLTNLVSLKKSLWEDSRTLVADTQFLMSESERINRIVQSMRGLSLVKSEKRRHLLLKLLQDTVDVMADYASKDRVEILLRPLEEGLEVSVDRDEFLQSLTNLIRNSIQAIVAKRQEGSEIQPHFQGQIEISTTRAEGQIQIRIADNGCGIPKENQSRLFDSHFTTKSRSEGTGLGLNISRRFLRAVGGEIQLLQSTPGLGSTFVLTLPDQTHQEREQVPA